MRTIHKTLIGLGCMAAIPVAAWFAIEFGGKRETFTIPSASSAAQGRTTFMAISITIP